MALIYDFDFESVNDIMQALAKDMQRRRLEKNITRKVLAEISGVSLSVIVRFESQHKISLESFVALGKALGYSKEIKAVLSEPKFSTMEELDAIHRNKHRKRASRKESER